MPTTGLFSLHRSHGPVELRVAESEDPPVGRHEPVTLAVRGRGHTHDGLVESPSLPWTRGRQRRRKRRSPRRKPRASSPCRRGSGPSPRPVCSGGAPKPIRKIRRLRMREPLRWTRPSSKRGPRRIVQLSGRRAECFRTNRLAPERRRVEITAMATIAPASIFRGRGTNLDVPLPRRELRAARVRATMWGQRRAWFRGCCG